MLVPEELAKEILEDLGPRHLEQFAQELKNSLDAIRGLEDEVVHLAATRNDFLYAPINNTSVAIH